MLVASDVVPVEPAAFHLAPDARQAVAITVIDPERAGTITATAVSDAAPGARARAPPEHR